MTDQTINVDTNKKLGPMLRGDRYRQTHQASVTGILGGNAPRVSSKGVRFYNQDRWTSRVFVTAMCKSLRQNPGAVVNRRVVGQWVSTANSERCPDPEIVIANTPDQLPLRTALALTGGAYHEAWHTYYSCKRDLTVNEMAAIVLPRWAQVKDWSKFEKALLEWSNIIEDIRIERRGRERFEGTYVKMCDLQDFVLDMEDEGRDPNEKRSTLTVIAGVFRDIGLGYNTEKQRQRIEQYKKDAPDAVELVLNGPLTPILKEAIALPENDDLGNLRLAMDVIIQIADLLESQESEEQSKTGQTGDGEVRCPKCGAGGDKIIVRPIKGRKDKGIATCTACGYQEEVDIELKPKPTEQQGGDPKENEDVEAEAEAGEDPGQDEGGEDPGQDKGEDQGQDKGENQGGGQGKGEDQDQDDAQGEGQGQDKGQDEDQDQGQDENQCQDGQDDAQGEDQDQGGKDSRDQNDGPKSEDGGQNGDEGQGQKGGNPEDDNGPDSDQDGNGENDKDTKSPDPEKPAESDSPAKGAGGHKYQEFRDKDWTELEEEISKGNGLKDSNQAFDEALGKEEAKDNKDIESGEQAWRPYNTGIDEVVFIEPSYRGKEVDTRRANKILASVKQETSYLRARLRNIIRALEMTSIDRGVPKGRALSGRYLVDTKTTLMAKDTPRRAYDQPGEQLDVSFAVAVVMDQSGSMSHLLVDAARVFTAITEPFDGLGCATLAVGFRNGRYGGYDIPDGGVYHRTHGVCYDIFKHWNERFSAVKWRFANTMAVGSTPMSDGIQFALDELSKRNEANRVMFVVTDGDPDGGHMPIIRRQMRLAREAGITIIGVGLDWDSRHTIKMFEDYIWSDQVSEIPSLIADKLNQVIDKSGLKRGRRVKKV